MRRFSRPTLPAVLLAGLITLVNARPAVTGDRALHQTVAAGGARPVTPTNRDLFDRLIGDWDVEVTYHRGDGSRPTAKGTWHLEARDDCPDLARLHDARERRWL